MTRPWAEAHLSALVTFLSEAPLNLVSRADRERVATVHIPECIAVADTLTSLGALRAGEHWIDVGCGGGLPGLVLAILHPDVHWVLLDSTSKKVAAVAEFVAQRGLPNVTAEWARAEDAARRQARRAAFAGAITRAVAALPVVAELSRGFVAPDGWCVAIKGSLPATELAAGRRAASGLALQLPQLHAVAAVRPTTLVTMRALGHPPARVPRPAGRPQHAPLGGERT